ncbi:non-ribosomal peptide synthetase [Saccharopolyspora pogona]|uniref:non-ribosomal peptide synthetase n=1 Tax=Saccharopolyspora pogona TaxID=333966 RepID=UPI001682DEBF|nr:non-ribosomal peptide synthetase [Saccharopolyspora pogona]
MPSLLDAWSRRAPAACAVRDGTAALSYRELDRRANAVAHQLVARGVDIGQRVGLFAHHGIDAVIAIVGILKAGGAYVPLDPASPPARIATMSEDADLSCVVGVSGARHDLDDVSTLIVDHEESASPPTLTRPLTGADLAYVMFTSGSTGRPKAVSVPHRAISRLVIDTNYVWIGQHDRVLHHSPLAFDASTFELWGALLNGARLVIADPHMVFSPYELHRWLRRESITVAFLTTAVFHQIATTRPDLFGCLHTLVVGGEAMAPEPARAVLANHPPQRLVNGYGPTENAVFTTAYPVNDLPDDAEKVPIGTPIARTNCHVQRHDGSRADVGEPGELVVGGDGLAIGYLNDPEGTAAKFAPDPCGTGRLYRTGDVCSMRRDGTFEFHGRRDGQVKLHGHRVELAEVEIALRAHPAVADVAVTRQQTATDAQLVAHIVARTEHEPPDAAELRKFLRDCLPSYLVPAAYRLIDRVPVTPQGKVDRAALTTPASETDVDPTGATLLDEIKTVWLRTLRSRGLTPDIAPQHTLFDVGGTSFDVLAIHTEMTEKFGITELTPLDIFTYPTLRGYTDHVTAVLRRATR